jgi:hypothetical protein
VSFVPAFLSSLCCPVLSTSRANTCASALICSFQRPICMSSCSLDPSFCRSGAAQSEGGDVHTRSTCRTRLKRLEEKAQAGKLLEMERPKIYVREAKPTRGRRGPTPRTGRPTIERKEVRKERRKERKRERRREQEREKQTVSPGPRINQTFRFLEGGLPVEGCRGHRRSRQAPVQASPSLLSSRLCFLCRIIVVGERSRKSESLCVRVCVCAHVCACSSE